jgi:hypothetical protein
MFYVKTAPDGSLVQYPYTLPDLRLENKGTSWPIEITDEVAADFGVFPVTPAPQPADSYAINLERTAIKRSGKWVEQWIETPATPEQITERTNAKAVEVRTDRNQHLADCDWTQVKDIPDNVSAIWSGYRQQLRDIPQQPGFPWDVKWPVKP